VVIGKMRKIGIVLIFSIILGMLISVLPGRTGMNIVSADTAALKLQTQVGFGNSNVKQGKWFQAAFTLTNPGEDVFGDLVILMANSNGNRDYSYVQHVELPKGSTKVVKLLLPGGRYTQANNRIVFYEDTVEKDKPISIEGKAYLETTSLGAEMTQVGVIARDPDTMNFLALLNQSGKPVNVERLTGNHITNEALALDGLDVLVLNDFAADTWQPEQVQAIQTWVQRGGTLFLAGGAGYPKTAGAFQAIAPVTYQATTSVTELPKLANTGEKELLLTEPFTLSVAGPVKDAEVVISEGSTPIFVKRASGLGEVWYAAYDLSLNPLASWNGNTKLWEKVLQDRFDQYVRNGQSSNKMNISYGGDSFWELNNALEYFPTLKPPKIGVLTWILMLYALVVGPILYFILRKMDRREWAWLLIPALAVITSFGIFQFGAANRGEMLSQAFSTVELDGNGTGMRQSAISLFVPKGGNLMMDLPEQQIARPFLNSELSQGMEMRGGNEMMFRRESDRSQVQLMDIPYSSLSKMSLEDVAPTETGKLEVKYGVEAAAGSMKGEVTNQTLQDLTHVAVIINQQYIPVGDLKKGEKLTFNSAPAGYISNPYDIVNAAFPYQGSSSNADNNLHQRSVLLSYLQKQLNQSGSLKPLVLGWSREQGDLFQINKKMPKLEQLTLWTQELTLNFVSNGHVYIPEYALVPTITENNLQHGMFEFQNGPFLQMGQGNFTFEFRLPTIREASFEQLNIQSEPNSDVTVQIWNGLTQEWDPLVLGQLVTMNEQKLTPYLLVGSTIRMKASTVQNSAMFRLPTVALEGTVKP
jgi:hypothetical protein